MKRAGSKVGRLAGLLAAGAITLAISAPSALPAQEARVVAGSVAHASAVRDLGFSADGKWLASFAHDKTIRLWETATGRLLRTITANASSTSDMKLLMGGRLVSVFGLTAAGKGTVFVFDTVTGAAVRTITLPEYELSPTRYGVTSRGDLITARYYQLYQRYNRWNIESGASRGEFGSEINTGRIVNGLSFFGPSTLLISSDDRWIVLGYGKHYQRAMARVELLDASSGRLVKVFDSHTGDVTSAIVSADGRLLASASEDKTVKIWDVAGGRLLQTLQHGEASDWIAFSPDGRWLASNDAKVVKIWDRATGRLVRTIDPGGHSYSGSFSPDGKLLAMGLSKVVKLHDAETGAPVRALGSEANEITIVPAPGGQLIVSDGGGRHVRSWNGATGQPVNSFGREGTALGDLVQSVGIDGERWLLGFEDERKLKLWDVNSNDDLAASQPRIAGGYKYAISPDGRLAAATIWSGNRAEKKIGLWDVRTGATLWAAATPWDIVFQPSFSPDGRYLSAMVDEKDSGIQMAIKVWDVATGRLVKSVIDKEDNTPSRLVYLPSIKLFAGWGSDGLKAYNDSARPVWKFSQFGLGIETAAVSLDYRWLAAAGDNTSVSIRALSTGQQVRQLSGNSGVGKSILFFDNGRRLAVGNNNGTSAIWSTENGEHLATTVHAKSGEWVTVTPEGFFVASDNGGSLVHVVRGFETFGIDQFFQALYRPDLVREKLAGDPRGLVRQAAAQLDLNRAIASGNAPDVRLTLPGRALGQAAVEGSSVSAEAEITDRGGGVGRVEWRVNGVTVGIDTPAAGSASPLRLSRSLALDPGANAIEVVAYNGANLIASLPGRASVTAQVASPSIVPAPSAPDATPPPAPVAAAKPRLFMLVAGIDDYVEKRIKLSYAVSDAKEVARGFREAGGNLYQSVEARLMTDADVTGDKLDAAFAEMAGKISASDQFVLYLAGHGKTVDGRYYFIPQDFSIDGEFNDKALNAAVKARGIAQERWQKWFASIPARKSVILFDTCDSGTLAGDETQELERSAANGRLAQATGRSILAASGGSQEAIEGYRGHGLFTYQLLDAIHRSDGDNSGTVELSELAAYVYGQVSEVSQKVFKQRQVPQIRITANYPLAKPTRVLPDEATPVAEGKPTLQLAQTAQLQVQPGSGATVVRSLSARTRLTVLESKNGWSLVASDGKPLGYVATRDLAPVQ